MKTAKITSKSIVLIHGLFLNSKGWNDWKAYFENQGYKVYTPDYPGRHGEPASLWKNVDPLLSKTTFKQVVNDLACYVDALPEKPILVGHSMGGLMVQKLLSMGRGVAGVAINGVPPLGVIPTQWSFWKSNFPVINYLKGNTPFFPTKKWFKYTFGNTLSQQESDRVFDELVVPEGRNIARGAVLPYAKVGLKKPHVPLLFIAGEKDNIMPAALNKKNFNAYTDKNSIKEFKEFAGRSHFTCGEPGWEEVAGYVNNWLNRIK